MLAARQLAGAGSQTTRWRAAGAGDAAKGAGRRRAPGRPTRRRRLDTRPAPGASPRCRAGAAAVEVLKLDELLEYAAPARDERAARTVGELRFSAVTPRTEVAGVRGHQQSTLRRDWRRAPRS